MEKPLMSKELIVFEMEAESKEEVIAQLAALMEQNDRLLNKTGYEQDVLTSIYGGGISYGNPPCKIRPCEISLPDFCTVEKTAEMG